ncbi:hypothetical protein ACE6H2_023232 [Prunus campanulata]
MNAVCFWRRGFPLRGFFLMVFVVDAGTFEERFLVFVFLISFNLLNRVSDERFLVSIICPFYYLQHNLTRGERLANQADTESSTINGFIRLANKTLLSHLLSWIL